jgi:exodeoxyribonuclease VII small subunit
MRVGCKMALKDFERVLEDLEKVVKSLESGEETLEDSIKSYEKGVKLYKNCQEMIIVAEKKITELNALLQQEGK